MSSVVLSVLRQVGRSVLAGQIQILEAEARQSNTRHIISFHLNSEQLWVAKRPRLAPSGDSPSGETPDCGVLLLSKVLEKDRAGILSCPSSSVKNESSCTP